MRLPNEIFFVKLTETAQIPKLSVRDERIGPEVGIDLFVDSFEWLKDDLIKVKSGVALGEQHHFWFALHARSGIWKRGLQLTNGVGVVDPTYRGDVAAVFRVVDWSLFHDDEIKCGDRLVQLVPHYYIRELMIVENSALEESGRGSQGFGSSGR